ncbi:MAG: MBL fold metallo-hydrolase, partial [Candidatus Aminicenantes bacterium]|nr:MBL fold metallo-hydrolase [Candidatus Aminicenantes bacterium]
MKKILLLIFLLTINISIIYAGEAVLESDTYKTDKGELKITFVGHASLIFEFDNMVIHVDPFSRAWNYENLPKADMIIITHHHGDHL